MTAFCAFAFALRVRQTIQTRALSIDDAAAQMRVPPYALRRVLSGYEPRYGVGLAIADWCARVDA